MLKRYFFTSLTLVLLIPSVLLAQAVNFLDESGNVHFADSVSQVPLRYQNQVIKKRPVIQTKEQYREAQKDFKKQQQDVKKKQKFDEKNAQKLVKERAKILARAAKSAESKDAKKSLQKLESDSPDNRKSAKGKNASRKSSARDHAADGADTALEAKVRRYGQE